MYHTPNCIWQDSSTSSFQSVLACKLWVHEYPLLRSQQDPHVNVKWLFLYWIGECVFRLVRMIGHWICPRYSLVKFCGIRLTISTPGHHQRSAKQQLQRKGSLLNSLCLPFLHTVRWGWTWSTSSLFFLWQYSTYHTSFCPRCHHKWASALTSEGLLLMRLSVIHIWACYCWLSILGEEF